LHVTTWQWHWRLSDSRSVWANVRPQVEQEASQLKEIKAQLDEIDREQVSAGWVVWYRHCTPD